MKVMDYDSWDSLNEKESPYDKVVNWVSKNFGGRVSKLDSLLSDSKKIHSDYHDEWEDTVVDMDSLEVQMAEIKKDPAELKKLKRIYERKKDLLDAINKKKEVDLKKISSKAEKIYDDNKRLKDYWDLELLKLESELAKDMYDKAKKLSDSTAEKSLYRKYEDALQRAKKKDEDFQKKYGSSTSIAKPPKNNYSYDVLVSQDNSSFEKLVKNFEKTQIDSLLKHLRRERNERYAMMDSEKENLENQKKLTSDDKVKRSITDRIKNLTDNYMKEIRDLRTKITIAKRYA